MSSGEIITVKKERVVIALRKLQLNLQRREELFRAMGISMLVSIRKTFWEQGSPADSWVPLAASTVKKEGRGPGNKILIHKAVLLNSVAFAAFSTGVKIGTNLIYARVQNFGSRDRGGAIGLQARIPGRGVNVKANFKKIHLAPRYERREVTRADGSKVVIPFRVFKETVQKLDKNGRRTTVTRLIDDPGRTKTFAVGSHTRFQNIPARLFMVFRPEDSGRLRTLAVVFANKARADAGLAGA